MYEIEISRWRWLISGLSAAGRVVIKGIQKQLSHQPFEETRKRKRMRPNPLSPWELRLGTLRVYYDVDESGAEKVLVRAVGVRCATKSPSQARSSSYEKVGRQQSNGSVG